MRYQALLLDFYGTLVEDDDRIVEHVVEEVAALSSVSSDKRRIDSDWAAFFEAFCDQAYGENYRSLRALALDSLLRLFDTYQVDLDRFAVADRLFTEWRSPKAFDDARWFVEQNTLPVCIVSDIDQDDLSAALAVNRWHFEYIVTSESCRSYKPRPEMFHAALKVLGCRAEEVLHIGNSLSADVAGAFSLGIDTAWINRINKLPSQIKPTFTATNFHDLFSELAG